MAEQNHESLYEILWELAPSSFTPFAELFIVRLPKGARVFLTNRKRSSNSMKHTRPAKIVIIARWRRFKAGA